MSYDESYIHIKCHMNDMVGEGD